MKNNTKWMISIAAVVALFSGAIVAGAATSLSYRTHNGDTVAKVASALSETPAQFAAANPGAVLQSGQTFSNGVVVTPPPTPSPVPPPTPTPPPASGETRLTAYVTGYGFPDNTPPSAEISNPVIHSLAGGTGTYGDPITIAVGHSISGGKDTLDYAAGTRFYIPALRRYFIVEDTCGDGSSPQNGPCHTGYQGHVWIDAWVGGTQKRGTSEASAVLNCEDTITDLHLVIVNPAANYAVVSGSVYSGSCFAPAGDTVLTQ